MKKNKKVITAVVFVILLFSLLVVNKVLKKDFAEEINYLNFESVVFEGSLPTEDNPYGVLAGEVDGKIFLTPGTSALFNVNNGVDVAFQYAIDEQVAAHSDGATLMLQFLSQDNEVVYEEELEVTNDGKWQRYELDRSADINCTKVKVTCNNGKNNSSICDWVMLKELELPTEVAEEQTFWKSAHYFADRWPKNFWDSELEDLDADFERISADGFNSIILVVPWREFQPEISNRIVYNEVAFKKLETILEKAQEYDLGVVLRVGYIWDFYQGQNFEELDRRYDQIIYNQDVRDAWLEYCKTIYNTVSNYENYWGSFICWEDFWGTKYDAEYIAGKSEESICFAEQIGYSNYMVQNYSIEEIGSMNNDPDIQEVSDIYIPAIDSGAFGTFYDFYDQFLNELLNDTQSIFPEMSMEVRVDDDLIINENKKQEYYSHKLTYPCEEASYTTIVYGIPMGFANQGERVSAKEALSMTENILNKVAKNNDNKKLYIDQFLFYDNAPAYSHNARIKDGELNEYLDGSVDILVKYCRGYGVWTYKNYLNDVVANGEFAYGLQSWETNDSVAIETMNDSTQCLLKSGGMIKQDVADRVVKTGADFVKCSFEAVPVEPDVRIVVSLNGVSKEIQVDSVGEYMVEFEGNQWEGFSISSKEGSAYIDNIKLYDFEQEGMLYDTEWKEKENIEAVRNLNIDLQSKLK